MLDTLVQSGSKKKRTITVCGKGSDLTDSKFVYSKGKKKLITQKVVFSLIKIAEQKQDSEILDSLWNTYYCQHNLVTANGRIYGKYCKNRICTVCCGNRKAEMITKYFPLVKTWKEPQFVTLTVKAVPACLLHKRLRDVLRAFGIIRQRWKTQNKRGKANKLMGVRSIECNFNSVAKTYNPHLHLIIDGKENAKRLVNDWLVLWTKKFANHLGQHIAEVPDCEAKLIELIKYGTKIFSDPDPNRKSAKSPKIYVAALYNVYKEMKGLRLFERFGFNLPTKSKTEIRNSLTEYEEWIYQNDQFEWKNKEDNSLTNYLPDIKLKDLLVHGIDESLQ